MLEVLQLMVRGWVISLASNLPRTFQLRLLALFASIVSIQMIGFIKTWQAQNASLSYVSLAKLSSESLELMRLSWAIHLTAICVHTQNPRVQQAVDHLPECPKWIIANECISCAHSCRLSKSVAIALAVNATSETPHAKHDRHLAHASNSGPGPAPARISRALHPF